MVKKHTENSVHTNKLWPFLKPGVKPLIIFLFLDVWLVRRNGKQRFVCQVQVLCGIQGVQYSQGHYLYTGCFSLAIGTFVLSFILKSIKKSQYIEDKRWVFLRFFVQNRLNLHDFQMVTPELSRFFGKYWISCCVAVINNVLMDGVTLLFQYWMLWLISSSLNNILGHLPKFWWQKELTKKLSGSFRRAETLVDQLNIHLMHPVYGSNALYSCVNCLMHLLFRITLGSTSSSKSHYCQGFQGSAANNIPKFRPIRLKITPT